MYRDALQKLEGIWVGSERVATSDTTFEATGRWSFHTVFDGLFLICDYVQTARDRTPAVAHGVFRMDEATHALTVSWFRNQVATPYQQSVGVAEHERLCFYEKQGDASTRTTYTLQLNTLQITTERAVGDGAWHSVFEGSYRRPR